MKYRNSVIALGFFTVIIQFLGVPEDWRNILFILAGLAVMALSYLSGRR